MSTNKPLLSIVSPVYEEEEALPHFHRVLCEVLAELNEEYDAEIIYIDDGSGDGSLPFLRRLAREDRRVRYYSFSRNFGHQAALTAGLERALGDAVVTLDSDLQHPPALIPTLLQRWKDGHDVVVTLREDNIATGVLRRFATRCFFRLLRLLSEREIQEDVSDYQLLSRQAVDGLLRLPETHRFLRGMVNWVGYPTARVPFRVPRREAGVSKFTLRRLTGFAGDALLSFSKVPLRVPFFLGAAAVVAGLAYAAYGLASVVLGRAPPEPGWTTVLATLYWLGGSILCSLSLVGEYVGRIYEQVKGRPLYLLKESSPDSGSAAAGAVAAGRGLGGLKGNPIMPTPSPHRPPPWYGYVVLALIVVGFAAWGVLVVGRTALLSRHMGDLDVYLRAAWAVREHPDQIYDIMDDNAWHYNYPPLFAILMTPLADPPYAADRTGMPQFAVSVAIFYALSLLVIALAVHILACALERSSPDPAVRAQPRGCWRWWALRVLPVVACLPPIGHTLMRGQANVFLLLLLCGAMAAVIHNRRWLTGACLAGTACLKIFPAYLLLYPLWRRDWRTAGGWALGLFVGLLLVPAVVLGPVRTVACYQKLAVVLIGPALHLSDDDSRAKELIEATATDSQSFLVVLHNTLHLDHDRWHRQPIAAPAVRYAHFALAGLFTLLTLAAASRRRREDGTGVALFLGALTLIMLVSSPVCHTHYFMLSLPLVMALLARMWDRAGDARLSRGVWVLLLTQLVGNALPLIPAFWVVKDAGLALYTALGLWAAACLSLWRGGVAPATAAADRGGLAKAA